MAEYYNRKGEPCSMQECFSDRNNRIVKQETLPNGFWVSTVFLGLNHSFHDGPPLIFETMVFPSKGNWSNQDCRRYSTEEEALKGHQELVEEWGQKKHYQEVEN